MTTNPDPFTTPGGNRDPLPVRPGRYVDTDVVTGVKVVVQLAVGTGGCCLIDGPVGVGKTTAVVEATRALGVNAVYVNMFGTRYPRDQMDAIWTAMTGISGVGSAATIRNDILSTLSRRPMTLLIDDAHRVGLGGLSPLLAIWNRLHASRGRGTPIVLCGNNLQRHLQDTLPELLSRSSTCFTAAPLGGRTLVATVIGMEPRIARTPVDVIEDIDRRVFKGELRRWDQFFDHVLVLRGPDHPPAPLTADEVQAVLALMPGGSTRPRTTR